MDTGSRQIPKWFMATGVIAMSLFIIGVVIDPSHTINEWKIAGGLVGIAGISTLLIANIKKEK